MLVFNWVCDVPMWSLDGCFRMASHPNALGSQSLMEVPGPLMTTLQCLDEPAIVGLMSASEAALDLLSQVALAVGRFESFSQLNHASRTIRQFQSNIIAALENGLAPGEADALKQAFNDSLLSGHAESDPPVSSVNGLLERLWDNQITGARLTRPYLQHVRERGII
jgi:hypothetical protein